jgi:hypothetical protein
VLIGIIFKIGAGIGLMDVAFGLSANASALVHGGYIATSTGCRPPNVTSHQFDTKPLLALIGLLFPELALPKLPKGG